MLGRLGSIPTCLPVSPSTPGVTSSPRQPGLGPWEAEAGRTSCLRHCPAAAGEGERWGVRPAPTAPHEEADLARSSRGPVPSLRVLAAPLSLAESLPFSAWLTPRQGCVGVPWRPAGPRSKRQRALAGSCCRTSFLSLAVTPHGVLMHMRHRAFPQRLVVKCLRALRWPRPARLTFSPPWTSRGGRLCVTGGFSCADNFPG